MESVENNKALVHKFYDEVWNNHTHLAVNKNTEFYSEDVAEFIVKELEK